MVTDRLCIRPLEQPWINEMTADYTAHQRLLNRVAKLSIDPTLADWEMWMVQLKDRTYIGDIALKRQHDTVEVGYFFQEDYRSQGYATESVGALLNELVQHAPVIFKAECLKSNIASQRVLGKLGFTVTHEDGNLIYWKK